MRHVHRPFRDKPERLLNTALNPSVHFADASHMTTQNVFGGGTYRLITRSDMDGLVCAVLLKELGMLGDILVRPPQGRAGRKGRSRPERDILTNLPYVPGCYMCFDHHASEAWRNEGNADTNYILQPTPSRAARVVYDHFGGKTRFPKVSATR